jgi:hypothetical protein
MKRVKWDGRNFTTTDGAEEVAPSTRYNDCIQMPFVKCLKCKPAPNATYESILSHVNTYLNAKIDCCDWQERQYVYAKIAMLETSSERRFLIAKLERGHLTLRELHNFQKEGVMRLQSLDDGLDAWVFSF